MPASAARGGLRCVRGWAGASPRISAISWSRARSSPPAKSPWRKCGVSTSVDDLFGRQIGDRALQCARHLNADLAVLLGNHQQQPVTQAIATDLPGVEDPVGVARDVFRLRGRDHQDDDLGALRLLKTGQLGFKGTQLRGIERAGLVHHPGGQGGHRQHDLSQGVACQSGQEPDSEAAATGPAQQKHRASESKGRLTFCRSQPRAARRWPPRSAGRNSAWSGSRTPWRSGCWGSCAPARCTPAPPGCNGCGRR